MSHRRVVVTGAGLLTPIGNSLAECTQALREGRSGVRTMPEWSVAKGLNTRVGATVTGFEEKSIPREFRRSMGRLALLAAAAANQATASAKLTPDLLSSGRAGLSVGQT